MNDLVIETNDLTKCYGEQVCVAQLCLHVPKGKIYALLGRNGAGKTTTMKMLLNLVKPTSGFIKIFNDIHLEDASKAYSRIGALIETPGFYDNLTGRENLEIIARLRGLNSIESVDQALSVVNLDKNDKKIFEKYTPENIEKKWQKIWDESSAFHAKNEYDKPKFYALVEFPYPSGQGLHVGHPRSYTALDIVARKKRMQGYNVLYPMGWDAFGLPTENYAIKNKIHPRIVTEKNISRFKSQLQALGLSFDWDREINTTDPDYYKWTQWIFLKLFKAGLAYKQEMPINWCTSCKVGLANEEVVNGVCERCGSPVVRKVKSEWMLKITDYADKLIEGLDHVDYIERVKTQQKNWIGRSTDRKSVV